MRKTKKLLYKQLEVVNRLAGDYKRPKHKFMTSTFGLDYTAQGWRLMTSGGCVNVSPRLTTVEMYWWLDGYITNHC